MTCARCGQPIQAGQLYLHLLRSHVACPTPREIDHARRMGRAT